MCLPGCTAGPRAARRLSPSNGRAYLSSPILGSIFKDVEGDIEAHLVRISRSRAGRVSSTR